MKHTYTFNLVEQAAGAESQDRASVVPIEGGLAVALADGAGGIHGGAEAATLFVTGISELAKAGRLTDPAACADTIRALDQRITNDPVAGETTGVVAVVREGKLHGASVGDSGAWLITSTGIVDLTLAQQRKPFLGTGSAMPVPFIHEFTGTLFVASDGLLKYASRETLQARALIESLEEAAGALVAAVRYASGALPDDVSVVLIREAK